MTAATTPSSATVRTLADLPGPRGLPLLGSALALPPERLHRALEDFAAAHGPLCVVRVGPRPLVVLSDAKLQAELLRARPDLYRRVGTIEAILDELRVRGVFSAEGSAWKPQRRLAMAALAPKNLRTFYPSLLEVLQRLHTRWERVARERREVDLPDELRRFTVDVTTRLVFGHDLNTLNSVEKDELNLLLEPIFPALSRRLGALVPYWRWIRLPRDRHLDRSLHKLFEWLGVLVDKTRHQLRARPELADQPENFLQAMLLAKDENGASFSEDVVLGNALTMLVAGEDTTSTTLAWAMHQLHDAPDARERLRQEAEAVCGAALAPADLEATNALIYAGAVAHETMRLRPAAPLLFMEPTGDTVLGDLALPRGTTVVLLTRLPGVSAQVAEADRFWPERWLPETESAQRMDGALAIPFGSGPRICPGRSLALLEMRLVLTSVYRRFDVERCVPAGAVDERFAFAMMPSQLPARIRLRQ